MNSTQLSKTDTSITGESIGASTEAFFDEIEAWEAAVEHSCAPLRISLDASCPLRARLIEQRFEALQLSRVTSVECRCEHDRQHISQSPDDAFLYSLQLQGEGQLVQGERSVAIRPGDGVLYDCSRPFQWTFAGDLQQLVVRLPRDLFRGRINDPDKCTALRIAGGQGIGRLLAAQLQSLLDERNAIQPGTRRYAAGSTVDLLAGVLSELSLQVPGPASNLQTYHLNRAYACIAERIRQPGLAPEAIAKSLGISLRYLHQLFHGTGTTVGRYIQDMRLDGCARELITLPARAHSISDLAYSWGFENSAHFSRVFRNRFQLSAREYRAQHSLLR
ncbi:helix-turn-helix domain-containing protein [Metapseudomonas lalkuanensis]|uniref:Helix-turn-helix domain-containing protein n=1 Tax=Metapseudomonas lalkuanensis TaxID=2604832 RepID=A0A5J6QK03_9GAMM|nr:helix-turn-helix domain-containing protein [Pseudomonas lalkuanensis]QEY63088.1 helix-turn-helix domain-containing protein [Pseudomonas lalkuanensis]